MGRPLAKRFFGNLNLGTTGTVTSGDAGLGGQSVASATGTAGAITAGTGTLAFPVPLGSGLGAVRATGTPLYTPTAAQITVGGTATVAYLATDILTQATTGVKFTPTLSTISGNTITNTNGTSVTVTSGSYIQGTSFITGATVTTTTGLAINTTYYVAATTSSSTTVTLASSYANAIAGTAITFTGGSTAISNGAVTIGTVAGTVTSAVYLSGTSTTVNTSALATTVPSSGAGHTIAVAQWSLTSATITAAGNGYVTTSTPSTAISASTAGASLTLGTITVAANGVLSFATAQSAGTFWVGQILVASGTDAKLADGNYIVTATNGTSTVTLATLTSATGLPTTVATTSAGTASSLALATAGTITLASVNGLVATGMKLVTTGTGGTSGVTAGTYFVIAVNSATKQISIASTYANFFTSTPVSITTAATIASTTAVGSQHLVVAVSGLTGSSGTLTAALTTASGNVATYGSTGNFGPAIVASAFLPAGSKEYSEVDIVAQKGSRRYRVETPDGTGICLLTSTTPLTAGFMTIGALDSAGNTYFVTKLTKNTVTLQQNVGSSFQFSNGASAKWTTGSAVASTTVTIDNA
jgi:hypothetical protein